MRTHPLVQWTVSEAAEAQYRLVEAFRRQFDGLEALQAGDYGAPADLGRSRATAKIEAALAEFFEAEEVVLVPGAGTGALRNALMASLEPGASIIVHAAPPYATSSVTFRAMGLDLLACDFNDANALAALLKRRPAMLYLQHSRQRLEDHYELAELIAAARDISPETVLLVDDNYTALQLPRIGTQLGADLSAFSLFKLLGEPGVGCVTGKSELIARIRADNYSGGTKIHGPVAIASYKGLVYAPVALALQAEVVEAVVERVNRGEVPGARQAYVGNHQERCALIQLEEHDAQEVIAEALKYGAAPYPVGSQSKYEISPMVYRLSRAMCEDDPGLARRMIRVNPFRSGPDTIIEILTLALANCGKQA
ncbi:MAG: hypothetical protein JWM85_1276 [Acidimicrobiaceae bacterium]|nr:hypothetical protein [Acidimicrobiaceae bacterium]